MLSTNKLVLENNLKNIFDKDGDLYKAAYNAHYTTSEYIYASQQNDLFFNEDTKDIVISASKDMKEKWKEAAKVFAENFTNTLISNNLHLKLADEIDKHIRSMQLSIVIQPQTLASIISPTGPCSGTLIINNETSNIQLL